MKFLKHKQKGFTLVETLVAVSIFSLTLVAVMSLLGNGLSDTEYAKQKMTASYLAQEGIEYVRNMRDTFVLYSSTSLAGWQGFNTKLLVTGALCNLSNGCYFDDQSLDFNNAAMPITQIPVTACGSTCPVLLYNAATGIYGYASGSNSVFVRKIQATKINDNETKITSTVTWPQKSGTQSITFSENLFNWTE